MYHITLDAEVKIDLMLMILITVYINERCCIYFIVALSDNISILKNVCHLRIGLMLFMYHNETITI